MTGKELCNFRKEKAKVAESQKKTGKKDAPVRHKAVIHNDFSRENIWKLSLYIRYGSNKQVRAACGVYTDIDKTELQTENAQQLGIRC